MGQIYLKVLVIMATLFAFAVPGFALKKLKLAGEGATFTLSNILLYVCQPALAVSAFCTFTGEEWNVISALPKTELLKNFGITAAIALVSMSAMLGLCKLVFIRAANKSKANVYSFVAVFSNCGFLGIPFMEMFGADPLAVMYIMVFNVVFNILCWTLGVALITGNLREIRLKKILLNPSIISCAVSLLLFFVPQINFFMFNGLTDLQKFPQYLSHMTAPLSMIIVGMRLAESNIKQLFCNAGVYLAGALRLLAAPFLTFAVAAAFYYLTGVGDSFVFIAPVIAMAMSPAASVVAMAERFGGDRQTAANAFITNTVISVVVIPLVVSAVMALWQLV